MKILFDTSALLKRYLPERGREAVLALVAQAMPMVAAPHCKLELYAALNRVRRETRASETSYRDTCAEVERNFDEMQVVPLSASVERSAIRALEASTLRGMDALHVGAALAAGVDLFVTADVRQFNSAQALGLNATLLKDA
ncbi:type II toxin-antitoxin system VapC family toxin [Polaromonas sp.]|jgi:predicted nucleic acid-binding protein|uniref:type II toxin-antitoxin system VapC family toxin n=1 Tax=Polaromonas sp. TaxID=1869339 RepID=UPI001A21051E|nr:type II toxin-antitoxin system VapC family toxin [Burkholderiales bacterium]